MNAVVQSLHIYPVKSLRGLDLLHAEVAPCGIAGDRRWLITDGDGCFRTQREIPMLARIAAEPTGGTSGAGLLLRFGERTIQLEPPEADAPRLVATVWGARVEAAQASDEAADWLSGIIGMPSRLLYLDDERARPIHPDEPEARDHVSFADAFPLLATSHNSLSILNASLDQPVPMARFRANLTISGLPPWSEQAWSRVRIGSMQFRVPHPCARCVVITRDQMTGETPHPGEPLRTLGKINRHSDGIVFGANLIPDGAGHVAVGDAVEVLETA